MNIGFSWIKWHKHRDRKIRPCGTKFILFFFSYLAHKCTSFYIKITTYHLPFKFESQNENQWSNFIFVLKISGATLFFVEQPYLWSNYIYFSTFEWCFFLPWFTNRSHVKFSTPMTSLYDLLHQFP